MTIGRIALVAVLGAALVSDRGILRAQQPDTDREVEEAKALYREANFSDAILKLQSAIEHLKLARDLEAKRVQLGDAYLHMALSYFALDNRAAARENLKGMLRLDRERRLDPQIYAPPVIELLEEARREVAMEPAAPPQPTAASSPAGKKKRGSKTVPILLGVGGAAAAGIAIVGSGGDSSGTTLGGTTTPTPSPTPTPNDNDVVLVRAVPPPGSTVSASEIQSLCGRAMCFSFLYGYQAASVGCLRVQLQTFSGCRPNTGTFQVSRGTAVPFQTGFSPNTNCGAPPPALTHVRVTLGTLEPSDPPCSFPDAGNVIVERFFEVNYTIVP